MANRVSGIVLDMKSILVFCSQGLVEEDDQEEEEEEEYLPRQQ